MSYSLERITKEFNDVCIAAGVPKSSLVPVSFNARLTKTLGRVKYKCEDGYHVYPSSVEFSKKFIETATDKSIKDVMLHEAAHLIVTIRTGENQGHNALFKKVCAELGTTNDKTTTKVERVEGYVQPATVYKYEVFCPTCEKVIGRYKKRCKTIDYLPLCTCKRCGNDGLKLFKKY